MRLVTTLHGWVQRTARTPLYYGIDRLCLRHYEQVYCVSPDLFEESRKSGVPSHRRILLENGIDVTAYRRAREVGEAKAALGIPPTRFLVGAVGRLSPEKGFCNLIRAVHQLAQAGLDVGLLLVGDGSDREALASLVRDLGLNDRVRLAGFQSDTRPSFEAMDVFALSSLREGLPNVVLEAMAYSIPVVATRVNGVPRLVCDGQNGLLVDPGLATALAAALQRLSAEPELCERLGAAGRATVERSYSFATRIEKLCESYDRLLRPHEVPCDQAAAAEGNGRLARCN
jgi:glycosyltransferase involved in cell wall biosynthesis